MPNVRVRAAQVLSRLTCARFLWRTRLAADKAERPGSYRGPGSLRILDGMTRKHRSPWTTGHVASN